MKRSYNSGPGATVRAIYVPLLLAIAILLSVATPCTAQKTPDSKDAWIAVLSKLTFQANDYQELQRFVHADPELVYAVLHDGYTRIENVTVRQFIIQLLVNGTGMRLVNGKLDDGYVPNPHLLDILALGLNDAEPQINTTAAQAIQGIAFRDIRTPGQFQQWRDEVGDQPVESLLNSACLSAARSLVMTIGDSKIAVFRQLLTASFHSGRYTSTTNGVTVHGIGVSGLAAWRRKAAMAAGLIDAAARNLTPENPPAVREMALRLIAHFGPDNETLTRIEPDIKREVVLVLDRPNTDEVYDMLAQIHQPWVADLLMQHVAQTDPILLKKSWALANALGSLEDRRAIPTLIALYDLARPEEFLGQVLERSLSVLTGVPFRFNTEHDADWWRDWWLEHKQEFPEVVRNMAYPRIAGGARTIGFSLRRHAERRTVGAGIGHDYWLLSPGILMAPSEQAHPGLIVVVSETPYSGSLARYWEQVAGQAWNGRYLVALIAQPPKGSSQTPASTRIQTSIVDVVKDAQAQTPIDPARLFMMGQGAAGLNVYAASLERTTPFRGFLLVSSPFRSAQLPSLATAKGRRYYLLHGKTDRTAPFFLAEAAVSMLKQHGASVRLVELDKAGSDTVDPSARTSAFSQAIQWLETGK